LICQISADWPAATKTFLDRSYNIDLLGGVQVSDQAWQNSFHVAIRASAATRTGSRRRRPPGNRLPGLLRRARHVVIPDGPNAIIWTHADEVNQALLGFHRRPLPPR
jgi:non-heme chloroperoxidase